MATLMDHLAKLRTCRKHAKAAALTPAQKGAITKARRKAERELAAMRDGYVPADAPVSPAGAVPGPDEGPGTARATRPS